METLIKKGHKETFPGEENVLYLDCGYSYKAVFICENLANYTPKMDVLVAMCETSVLEFG